MECKTKRAETPQKVGQSGHRKIDLFGGGRCTYVKIAPEGRFGASNVGPF